MSLARTLGLLVLLDACAVREPTVLAVMKRSSMSASWDVTVMSDGLVRWNGVRRVQTLGLATKQLTSEQLKELRHEFAVADFMKLDDDYTCREEFDAPVSILTFNDGASTKTIKHYHGCRSKPGAAALNLLELRFEKLVGTVEWVGVFGPIANPY